jgi:hypothetical protein
VNLVASLGSAQFLFLFITVPTDTASCKTVSALLMYFLLAFFGWMNVEAYHLFNTFVNADVWNVDVGGAKLRRYMLCAWGLPVVFVAVTFSNMDGMISMTNVRSGETVLDSRINYCWFDSHGTARWYFLVPMLLSVGINLVLSIIVFHRVKVQLRRESQSPKVACVCVCVCVRVCCVVLCVVLCCVLCVVCASFDFVCAHARARTHTHTHTHMFVLLTTNLVA